MNPIMAGQPRPTVEPCLSVDFQQLAYVVYLPECRDVVVIDPGLQSQDVLAMLDKRDLTVRAVLNTHGHGDHIAGNAALLTRFPEAQLAIGRLDAPALADPQANLSAMFGFHLASPPATHKVDEGDTIRAAGLVFDVLHIPGHTPGHVAFVHRSRPLLVFDGDTLFAGSIGRTDFPRGDHDQLISGIRRKLLTLPDDTILYPGHGPETTVGVERATNPYL